MDITTLGIGALIGAVITSTLNLFISWRSKERDDLKERLEKLYLPLSRILKSPQTSSYEIFLQIENLYTEFEHLASPKLELVLYDVLNFYHSLPIEDLTDDEVKQKMLEGEFKTYKHDVIRDFNAIMHDIYGVVEAGRSELLRQYRGGFQVHIFNFIQSLSSSPYSPKEWRRDYAGYKDDN